MTEKHDHQEFRDLILLATLPHVVFEGWSASAMEQGAADFPELGDKAAERAFPGGPADLAAHFADWADRRMLAEMEKLDIESMRVRDRIAAGVRLRLQVLSPHREAIRRMLAFLALPGHAGLALKATYNTSSAIWYAAGDESTDFNFYTKRGLLAPVLVSTTLYWMSDAGDENGDTPDTWDFLDRRIGDVLKIPPLKARISNRLSQMPSPFKVYKRFAEAVQARR
ncbi:MAG: COQ9 family protein [Rhodospirillaceae bacterium]|jgi:ubiquinone biosynthesis protein COQ9|nr:COQ9 family protein [Rhodospirillaceae bacterium]MBT4218910.1 COQ9 family protein [Rhodospirillaceae bacterium]MBT4464862.1 COQ9 family protein [Rhodospirillaceae bacterium]MBT5013512.1 COQ9 family protein [Rhodospirillaceae bacterium]MBT5309237.1 COQ9 family protein [Rhodospirillaceae bacterium]